MDLLAISRLLGHSAMQLGGSEIHWYKALFCPYVKSDGSPCYDESRGSAWAECPVCGGRGAIYASPRLVKGIYTDNSNKYLPDGSGGFMQGEKTLSLPHELHITLLKHRSSDNARRFLRDKFELLGRCCNENGERDILELLYLKDDPVKPTVSSGHIYQIVNVVDNY